MKAVPYPHHCSLFPNAAKLANLARIALKVDVDTLRGTLEGVPRLLRSLAAAQAQASFLFSLGPDHTGWALRRVFRPGFLRKVSRTSVLEHYGLKTLLYGVLLPAPDIGRKAAEPMQECQRAGFECGIHTWDHVVWQDRVRTADAAWTVLQMQKSFERFTQIFDAAPATHGAAGWQMNDAAWLQLDAWGLRYASDGRGNRPFVPTVAGRALKHVQWPTTLPTLDELIGVGDITESNVERAILRHTETDRDQVYTLHAELEGGLLAPAFERLLSGWHAQGHQLVHLGALHQNLNAAALSRQPMRWGNVPGRSGELLLNTL